MILLVHFRTSDFLSKLPWLQDVGNFQSLPENFRILEFFKKFSKNFKNVFIFEFLWYLSVLCLEYSNQSSTKRMKLIQTEINKI